MKTVQDMKDNNMAVEDYVVNKETPRFGFKKFLYCSAAAMSRNIAIYNMLSFIYLTPKTNFLCVEFKDNSSIVNPNNSTCYDDCLKYTYESDLKETLISEFDLICQRYWMANFGQTVNMFGILAGVFVFGWISDSRFEVGGKPNIMEWVDSGVDFHSRYELVVSRITQVGRHKRAWHRIQTDQRFGRRTTLILSLSINLVLMIAVSFSPNYWVFITLKCFIGIASSGPLIISIPYILEVVDAEHRELAGTCAILPDSFAMIMMTAIAYFSVTWRHYLLAKGIICAIYLVPIFFIPETPRWLELKRKMKKTTPLLIKSRKNTNKEDPVKNNETLPFNNVRKTTYLDLFRTKKLTVKILSTASIWAILGSTYYGVNEYSTFLGFNVYLVMIIISLSQVPTTFLAMILGKKYDRKKSLISNFLATGLVMGALIVLPTGHWASIACCITGLNTLGILTCIVYIYVTELFPTSVRSMAYGVCGAGAKVGAMVAPFIATLNPQWLSAVVFVFLVLLGVVLCLLLPETKGKSLEDT